MRFFRHDGIYRSDVSSPLFTPGRTRFPVGPVPRYRTRRKAHALPIVRDEFRPAIPRRVARQHCPPPLHRHHQIKTIAALNGILYHRTVASLLTVRLSAGDKPTDSPVGQAAWIYDRFITSTDSHNHPDQVLTKNEMLDDILIYWLTATAASSARLYWESFNDLTTVKLDTPVGCTIFPGDVLQSPKVWSERTFSNLIYWNRAERGGHFAAFEQPAIFVREVRDCFRSIRS